MTRLRLGSVAGCWWLFVDILLLMIYTLNWRTAWRMEGREEAMVAVTQSSRTFNWNVRQSFFLLYFLTASCKSYAIGLFLLVHFVCSLGSSPSFSLSSDCLFVFVVVLTVDIRHPLGLGSSLSSSFFLSRDSIYFLKYLYCYPSAIRLSTNNSRHVLLRDKKKRKDT